MKKTLLAVAIGLSMVAGSGWAKTSTSSIEQRLQQLEERLAAAENRAAAAESQVQQLLLPSGELVGGHEDVGRHVALDKLLGRRAQEGEAWGAGAALVSSRASYEMVQKSAMCGIEILFAVSAATTLAVEVAERCNLTLVGFCKPGRATIYTHPQRLKGL